MIKIRPAIFIVVLIILVFLSSYFLELDYKINIYGKVYPAKEFFIMNQGGVFSFKLIDYLFGFITDETVYRPERGDIVQFQIKNFNNMNWIINKGDTIGIFLSSYIKQKIKELKGELAYSVAELNYYQSPQKDAIIELAKEKLSYAKRDYKHKKRIYERSKELYEKELISEEEFDIIKNDKDLAEINIRIAEAELKNVSTGEKPELIDMTRDKINKFRTMLDELEKQKELLYIKAPFSGKILPAYSADTLCILMDNQNFIIVVPIDIKISHEIKKGMKVKAKIVGKRTRTLFGEVSRISDEVVVLNGKQKRLVFVEIHNGMNELIKGMIAKCSIKVGRRKIISILFRYF